MGDFLDGLERELPVAVSAKTRVMLKTFKSRLNKDSVKRRQKRFEQELETFLQSKSYLRAASRRHILKIMPPILDAAVAAVKKAAPFL
jgi:hypothetical protein